MNEKNRKNKDGLEPLPSVDDLDLDEDFYFEDWRERQGLQDLAEANCAARAVVQKKLTEVI